MDENIHISNLLKIQNHLLDMLKTIGDGYMSKNDFLNTDRDSIRHKIQDRLQSSISNIQSALINLGHDIDDDELVGDISIKANLKGKNNVN